MSFIVLSLSPCLSISSASLLLISLVPLVPLVPLVFSAPHLPYPLSPIILNLSNTRLSIHKYSCGTFTQIN
jgi:hypothetical protein